MAAPETAQTKNGGQGLTTVVRSERRLTAR